MSASGTRCFDSETERYRALFPNYVPPTYDSLTKKIEDIKIEADLMQQLAVYNIAEVEAQIKKLQVHCDHKDAVVTHSHFSSGLGSVTQDHYHCPTCGLKHREKI